MGANSSTCLPCKASGGTSRRGKGITNVLNNRDNEGTPQLLKKVSTAAEQQARSGTAGKQPSTPHEGSPTNGALSSSQSLQDRGETLHSQVSRHLQAQTDSALQPADSTQLERGPTGEKELAQHPSLDGAKRTASGCQQTSSNEGPRLQQTKRLEPAGEEQSGAAVQHQDHINIPSHMLAVEADPAWQQQHPDAQQALLSPHSCSVAHRVAAALRAAAGERAAAAAARAAEAAEAAKMAPKGQGEPPGGPGSFGESSKGFNSFRSTRDDAGNDKDKKPEERQLQQQQSTKRPTTTKNCLSQVSCFSPADDSGNEINVRQGLGNQEEAGGTAASAQQIVLGAAKRVGELLSSAAAALASPSAAEPETPEAGIVQNDQEACAPSEWQKSRQTDSGKGSELADSAAAFLGAVDRAMDTISSEGFKKQAVTLLSQSVSVAASLVEAVKTCGDTPRCRETLPSAVTAVNGW